MPTTESLLIYDWNNHGVAAPLTSKPFALFDETLRDGIQSPSVTDPSIDDKRALLHLMARLGIGAADVGLPGAGPRAFDHSLALIEEIVRHRLPITPACAARTMVADIAPIADIAQRTGTPVEVYAFIGSSPIRLYAEDWSVDTLLQHIDAAITFAVQEGLPVCLVTEDTTRSSPEVLDRLFRRAVDLGVRRFCLCDTVGHATGHGLAKLFAWAWQLFRTLNVEAKLDWHGHNDRGLGLSNALHALACGADRVHGTALGIGERVGNTSMDQLLLNLKLHGAWPHDVTELVHYCQLASRMCDMPIPNNYPVAGRDAFRTGTGVHAAAIIKAQKKSDTVLADRIYSGVPATMFGRRQEIEIGPMSGMSNVMFWLESRHIEAEPALVNAILTTAKSHDRVLTEGELNVVVQTFAPHLPIAARQRAYQP